MLLFKCSIAFDMGMKIGYRPLDLTWTWPDHRSVLLRLLGMFTHKRAIISLFILLYFLFFFSFYVEIIFKDFLIRIGFPSFFFLCFDFRVWLRTHTCRGKRKQNVKKEINGARQQTLLFNAPSFTSVQFRVCKTSGANNISFPTIFPLSFLHFPLLSRIPSFEPSWEILEFCKLWYK